MRLNANLGAICPPCNEHYQTVTRIAGVGNPRDIGDVELDDAGLVPDHCLLFGHAQHVAAPWNNKVLPVRSSAV